MGDAVAVSFQGEGLSAMLDQATSDILIGERFRIAAAAPLFVDPFGEVFRGIDERDGSGVFVRVLHPDVCVALGATHELIPLAHGTAALRHSKLAALLDVIVERERCHLVSEACEGESLAQLVERNGPLDEASAANLVADVAAALAAIHAAGAVHGRLDPTRIVISEKGAKVIDFGLGMLLGDDTEEWRTTLRDVEDPAVAFLSPEQACGEGPPRPESDIWALSAVLHFAVTGASPYSVKTRAAQAASSTRGEVIAPVGVDEHVAVLVRAGLSADPAVRPTLREIVERLRPRRVGHASRVAAAIVAVLLVLAGIGLPRANARRKVAAPPPDVTAPEHVAAPVVSSAPEPEVIELIDLEPSASVSAAKKATTPSLPAPRVVPRAKPSPRDPFYGVSSAGF